MEGGFGFGGAELEVAPTGGLDDNKGYLKGSGSVEGGPLGNLELTYELSSDGNCVKATPNAKACVLGVGADTEDGLKVNPEKLMEGLKPGAIKGGKPGKLDAKLLTGVCQNALW